MSESSQKNLPETSNRKQLLMEAYKRTLLRLDAQQTVAIASDQRALVASGVSVAGAALINTGADATPYQLIAIGLLIVASICGMSSATPQALYTSGSHFNDLSKAIETDADFHEIVTELAKLNDTYIDRNEELAKSRSNKFSWYLGFFCFGALFYLLHLLST